MCTRGAIFRKITSQNQTDTNEMATTETKYQTDFYSAQKYQYLTNFKKIVFKIPIKYQEDTKKFRDRNTKYRFGFGIFLAYQIFGFRLASLMCTFEALICAILSVSKFELSTEDS